MDYFKQDLENSEAGVQEIANLLVEHYTKAGHKVVGIKFDKTKAKDLGIRLSDGRCDDYEIKEDYLHHSTGNLAVEFSCNSKLSGITATKANYWVFIIHENKNLNGVFGCGRIAAVTTVSKLKALLESKSYRKMSGGDGGRAQMYLVPADDFLEIAFAKIPLSECSIGSERHKRRRYD